MSGIKYLGFNVMSVQFLQTYRLLPESIRPGLLSKNLSLLKKVRLSNSTVCKTTDQK